MDIRYISNDGGYQNDWDELIRYTWAGVRGLGEWNDARGQLIKMSLSFNGMRDSISVKGVGFRD